jgi:hypothetical protein
LDRLRDGRPARVLLWITLGFAAMLAAGWGAEWVARRTLDKFWRQAAVVEAESPLAQAGGLLLRLLLDGIALCVFVAAALLLFFLLTQGNPVTRSVVMTYLGAVVAVRGFAILSRFLLAPALPGLRLLRIGDADARYLYRQGVVIAAIAAFGFLTCSLLRQLGSPEDAHRLLSFAVGLVLLGSIVFTLVRARAAVSGDLAWDPVRASRVRVLLARAWPAVTIVTTVLIYLGSLVVTLTGGSTSYPVGLTSLLTVILVPHIDAILERAAQRLEGLRDSLDSMGGQLRIVALRAARILLIVTAVLFLAQLWGIDLFVRN